MNQVTGADRSPTVAVIGTRGYPSFYGGFETAVRRIAPALCDLGWRVRVYGRKQGVKQGAAQDPRIETVFTPGIESRALSTLTFGLTTALHALVRKPDVALVMNVANGYWLPLLKARGIPTVVNVDGIEWERDKWSRLGKAVFRCGAWLTARFADELVFDAEAIGDYWERTFGRSGTFIPYGGEGAEELPLVDDLESGRFVLLVARFVPENSVMEFLEAVPSLITECDVDVVLVGSAPSDDPLQVTATALAHQEDRLRLLGHINDDRRLFSLWQHAGVYFHGHTVGGTNPALVQAMALGARVVARDTVYNREVLGPDGFYCGPDVDSIVAAVTRALGDKRPLGEMNAARAQQHYSWELVVNGYAEALARQLAPSDLAHLSRN